MKLVSFSSLSALKHIIKFPNTPLPIYTVVTNFSQFDVFLTAHHSTDFSKYQPSAQFL